jgi:hypothetical protein
MVVRNLAKLVGLVAIVMGIVSCDDGGSSSSSSRGLAPGSDLGPGTCCTFTDDYGDTYSGCYGGTISYDGRTYTLTGGNWNQFVSYVYHYGGTCYGGGGGGEVGS